MTYYNTQISNTYWDSLGSFWTNLSSDQKAVIEAYWESLDSYTKKLYIGLYNADLSRGIKYIQPYFEYEDEYFDIVFSGIGMNTEITDDGNYRYYISGLVSLPTLVHRITDTVYSDTYSDITYYDQIDYTVIAGYGVEFINGLKVRNDPEHEDTTLHSCNIYAPTMIVTNPALFRLYGQSIGFEESYYTNEDYYPTYTYSGLPLAGYEDFYIPPSGLLAHFDSSYGTTVDSSNNLSEWVDRTKTYTATVSGIAYPSYADSIVTFATGEVMEISPQILLSGAYTAFIVSKCTSTQNNHIIGQTFNTLASFCVADPSNAATSYDIYYNDGTSVDADNDTATTDANLHIAEFTRTLNDGHWCYHNSLPIGSKAASSNFANMYLDQIGGGGIDLSNEFIGDIHEIILYDRVISGIDRLYVEKYLSTKYDITLDAGNTYSLVSKKGVLAHTKALIEALCSVSSQVPSVTNLKKGCSLAFGLPFAYVSGIATVTGDYITVGDYVYTIPAGIDVMFETGDAVNKFDILFSGLELWDMVNNSGLILEQVGWSGLGQYQNKYLYETELSGTVTSYSADFVNSFTRLINPAGLTYKFLTS